MYKLVIAEDEEKILEGIANLFPWNQIGFEVAATYANGRDLLAGLKGSGADAVFSDIEMPFMDGIELASALCGDAGLPIVLFSSYQKYEYFRSAIRLNVFDYLLKPINANELIACFERLRQKLDRERSVRTELPPSYYKQIIDKVSAYLEEHYRDASLEKAALLVHMSPNYLSRIYKDKSGRGFSEILLEIRMRKAREYLGDISYKSYEIAYHVGYDNPANFSRAFKAYYNMTPKEYRMGKA